MQLNPVGTAMHAPNPNWGKKTSRKSGNKTKKQRNQKIQKKFKKIKKNKKPEEVMDLT
jgi:hypothetical protein